MLTRGKATMNPDNPGFFNESQLANEMIILATNTLIINIFIRNLKLTEKILYL